MAALTATEIGLRLPMGNVFQQIYSVTVASQSATDEWIATGFRSIDSVWVSPMIGTAGAGTDVSVVLNAQGTGASSGANPGDLGIETVTTTNQIIHVGVIGR